MESTDVEPDLRTGPNRTLSKSTGLERLLRFDYSKNGRNIPVDWAGWQVKACSEAIQGHTRLEDACSTMYRISPERPDRLLENLVEGRVVNRELVRRNVKHWARVALDCMLKVG